MALLTSEKVMELLEDTKTIKKLLNQANNNQQAIKDFLERKKIYSLYFISNGALLDELKEYLSTSSLLELENGLRIVNSHTFSVSLIPKFREGIDSIEKVLLELKEHLLSNHTSSRHKDGTKIFVSIEPIEELSKLTSSKYDFSRLIQICKELNVCYQNQCFLAVAALVRALIDHIPPVFGFSNFNQVVNNYAGSRSFKKSMEHLGISARNIGDAHLHIQIRESEVLPTETQVDFSNDLDVLLAEIVRISKEKKR